MAKNSSTMPVLAVILAIPAVACYVWWTHLNTETRRQLTLRVRSRTDGVSFGAAVDRNKLSNPIAALPAPAAASIAASSAAAAAPLAARPAAVPASAPAPAAIAAAASVPAATAASAVAAPPGATAAGQVVVIARDPMISPFDVARLRQIEYEKEQERLELEAAQRGPKRRREAPIEQRIELEGIIGTERGNRAIVNGDTVRVGDSVAGAKVLRITGQSVVFVYKNRRFSKSISK